MNKSIHIEIGLRKIEKPRSLTDLAYEGIKEKILQGKLLAGEIYSELELAKTLGISKTPVREALIRLSADHLIVFHPQKGISVNYFSRKDIESLFEMREIIECAAITKLQHLPEDHITTLRDLILDQERDLRLAGGRSFFDLDRKFHLCFIEASGNRFMVQTSNNMRNYIAISSQSALIKKGRGEEVLQEHKAIVAALSAGDGKKAIAAVKVHLERSKIAALESFQETLEPSQPTEKGVV